MNTKLKAQLKKLKPAELKELRNWCLKDLFNGITEDDILVFKNGAFIVGNKIVPQIESLGIIDSAKSIKNMDLWKYIIKEAKYAANVSIFNSSQSLEDIFFGKAMLKAIEVMENRVDNISRLSVKKE